MVAGVETREFAAAFQKDLIRFAGKYAGYYTELGRLWQAGRVTDGQYMRLCVALERAAHDGSAGMAADFVSEFRRMCGAEVGRIIVDDFTPEAAFARTAFAVKKVGDNPDDANRTVNSVASGMERAVMNAARDTVEWSAGAEHRTWRRVTDGDPCAFCAMLATRDDYTTKERAISAGHVGRHRRKGKRPVGARYHDHCGCTVVEVVGPWERTKADERYMDVYQRARERCAEKGLSGSPGNILAMMRDISDMR